MSFFHSLIATSGFPLDTGFDSLNLQSNTADNFTLVGDTISQWTDLSPAARHAKQTSATNRPTLNGLDPTFDGSLSRLVMDSEFSSNEFSLYMILTNDAPGWLKWPIGGGNNQIIQIGNAVAGNGPRVLYVSNTGVTNGSRYIFSLYGEEFYQVLSIRRNSDIVTVKCNGRTLYEYSTSAHNTVSHAFRYIGYNVNSTGSSAFNWAGIIKAVCINSECFDDDVDNRVVSALYKRYGLPEESNAITGFGDSITVGLGSTNNLTDGWLPTLGTLKGRHIKNFGISGSRITASSADSGVTRFESQLIERPYSDTVCILYGTNDISANVTGGNYQSALETVLNGLISAGYDNSNIFVGTVPYRQGNADESTVLDYNSRINSVCSALGISVADVYNSMLNGGGDLLMNDTVHPNDAGHLVIRDAFATVIP